MPRSLSMWLKEGLVFLFLSSVILNVNAQRGRTCRTPNGETATCKSIYDCGMLLSVVRSQDVTQIRFIRESQCGFDQNPLVCCGTENNYISRSTVRTRTRISLSDIPRNDAIPSRQSCGFQESDYIYGGNATTLDEFPWMALLQYRDDSGSKRYSCGAALINPRYVLTAAHCVTGDIVSQVGQLVTVRLGEWNTKQGRDCTLQAGINICNNPPVDVGVEEAVFHPNYKPDSINRYDDIALVRLNQRVSYSNFIRPICLPLLNEVSRDNEKLVVSGWGKTQTEVRSPIKMKLEVPIQNKARCAANFQQARIALDETQICAGGEAGKDSCIGDSGGPLMRTSTNDTTQWYIEGIVSFGTECGTEGWAGVYTKVNDYLDWIYKTVRN